VACCCLPIDDPLQTMEPALEAFEPGFELKREQPRYRSGIAFSPSTARYQICIYIINARPASVLARFKHTDGRDWSVAVCAAELAFGCGQESVQRANRRPGACFYPFSHFSPLMSAAAWA